MTKDQAIKLITKTINDKDFDLKTCRVEKVTRKGGSRAFNDEWKEASKPKVNIYIELSYKKDKDDD